MKPLFWVIKSDRFDTILANNGKFYRRTPIDNFKTYRREGDAINRLLRLNGEFTAYAIHDGDSIDCCGRITRKTDLITE